MYTQEEVDNLEKRGVTVPDKFKPRKLGFREKYQGIFREPVEDAFKSVGDTLKTGAQSLEDSLPDEGALSDAQNKLDYEKNIVKSAGSGLAAGLTQVPKFVKKELGYLNPVMKGLEKAAEYLNPEQAKAKEVVYGVMDEATKYLEGIQQQAKVDAEKTGYLRPDESFLNLPKPEKRDTVLKGLWGKGADLIEGLATPENALLAATGGLGKIPAAIEAVGFMPGVSDSGEAGIGKLKTAIQTGDKGAIGEAIAEIGGSAAMTGLLAKGVMGKKGPPVLEGAVEGPTPKPKPEIILESLKEAEQLGPRPGQPLIEGKVPSDMLGPKPEQALLQAPKPSKRIYIPEAPKEDFNLEKKIVEPERKSIFKEPVKPEILEKPAFQEAQPLPLENTSKPLMQQNQGLPPQSKVGVPGPLTEATNLNQKNRYYRFTKSAKETGGVPWKMFAKDRADVENSYGKQEFNAYDNKGNVVDVNHLLDDIKKALDNHKDILDEYQTDASSLAKEASPSRIVDSAGLWDNPDITQIIYDEIIGPKNIDAVKTNDGLIIFNTDLIEMVPATKDPIINTTKTVAEIPKIPVTEKPVIQPKIEQPLNPNEKVNRVAQSIEIDAIANDLTKTFGDLPTHKGRNMKQKASEALDFINRDEKQAVKVAMGEADAPPGLNPEEVFTALRVRASKLGDVETLRDLALNSKISRSEATILGQRIKALDAGLENDPVAAIKQIHDIRQEKFKRRTLQDPVKAKTREATRLAKEFDTQMKKSAPKANAWVDFVNSIRC